MKHSCPLEYRKYKATIQSSFGKLNTEAQVYPSRSGFANAAVDAYSGHHHFTFRPEDVWFAILSQLSMYINAHAEDLGKFFVAHEGKKKLTVYAVGTIHTVDFGALAKSMSDLIGDNVVDPELKPWIMPAFSTTTETDQVVAAVMMMGSMQRYFSYGATMLCGIPSVTLLGINQDWEEILQRLEKLPLLGDEPTQFYHLLKPVLTRFVRSFDAPDAPEIINFWRKIAHESGGSGPTYLSGWITAFLFWDENGECLYPSGPIEIHEDGHNSRTFLDVNLYHRLQLRDIPCGYCSVPVEVNDNCKMYDTVMVEGSVGIHATSTGQALEDTNTYTGPSQASPGLDSLKPESGWWMFEIPTKPVQYSHDWPSTKTENSQIAKAQTCSAEKTDQGSDDEPLIWPLC